MGLASLRGIAAATAPAAALLSVNKGASAVGLLLPLSVRSACSAWQVVRLCPGLPGSSVDKLNK